MELLRSDMIEDRIDGKHWETAKRMIKKGGRQDVFLGSRECQGYVEPCSFGEGQGHYDGIDQLAYGLMFHGSDYPDETGKTNESGQPDESGKYRLHSRFWYPTMVNGIIEFLPPVACSLRKHVREMVPNPPRSVGLQELGLIEELGVSP